MNKLLLLGLIILLASQVQTKSMRVEDFLNLKNEYCQTGCPEWDTECLTQQAELKTCIEENEECGMYHLYLQLDEEDAAEEIFDEEVFDSCNQFCRNQIEFDEKSFFYKYNIECIESAAQNEEPVYKRNGEEFTQNKADYLEEAEYCQDEAKKEKAAEGNRYITVSEEFKSCTENGKGDDTYCKSAHRAFTKLGDDDQVNYQTYVCLEFCAPQETVISQNKDIVESGLFQAQLNCQLQDDFNYEMSPETEEELGEDDVTTTLTYGQFRENKEKYCPYFCPDHNKQCVESLDNLLKCIETNPDCVNYHKDLKESDDEDLFNQEDFNQCWNTCSTKDANPFFQKYTFDCTQTVADEKIPVFEFQGDAWTTEEFTQNQETCQAEAEKNKMGTRYLEKKESYTECFTEGTQFCINANKVLQSQESGDEVPYESMVCQLACEPNNTETQSGLFNSEYACLLDKDADFEYTPTEKSEDEDQEPDVDITFGEFRARKQQYCPSGCPAGDKDCLQLTKNLSECIETNEECKTYHEEMQNVDDDQKFDWISFNNCWNACDVREENSNADILESEFFTKYHFLCVQTIADEKTPIYDFGEDKEAWTTRQYLDQNDKCSEAAGEQKQGHRYNEVKKTYDICQFQTTYCENAGQLVKQLDIDEEGQAEVPFESMVCYELCKPDEEAEVQSGLFTTEYNCYIDIEAEFEYIPSKESEEEEVEEVFTFGDFRARKDQYCPSACPAGDKDCLQLKQDLSECIKSNVDCKTYHEEIQKVDNDAQFDWESFNSCWNACDVREENSNADIIESEFFTKYHFLCVQTIADEKTPVYDFGGDKEAWTTRQYLDQNDKCSEAAGEQKQGHRYNEVKKTYDICQFQTTYCENAGQLVKQLDIDEEGQAEVPFESMVCYELCKPDEEAEVQSGLFTSEYNCYIDIEAEFEYTPSKESEEEEVEDVFTFGNFRDNKESYCPATCPHADQQCKDDVEQFRDCIKENVECQVYNKEIQIVDNETQFDLEAFNSCWEACKLTDDISNFFQKFHYDCEITVSQQETPEYFEDSEAQWTTQEYYDNEESCNKSTEEQEMGKRYKEKKQIYDLCQKETSYCINAEKENQQIHNEEEGKGNVYYSTMVCLDLCKPDDTENKSGLFDAQYECLIDKDSDFSYTQSEETEKELEDEGGDDVPHEIDMQLGQFYPVNIESKDDQFTFTVQFDPKNKDISSYSINVEFPSGFHGLQFSFSVGNKNFGIKKDEDLDKDSRKSQFLLEDDEIAQQTIQNECEKQKLERCEGILKVSVKEGHDKINKNQIETIVQMLQELVKEEDTHQYGPIQLDLESAGGKLRSFSQNYQSFEQSKYLFKLHYKYEEGSERFLHVSENLGSNNRFIVQYEQYNEEPTDLGDWKSLTQGQIQDELENNNKHYQQGLLDKCKNGEDCWYAITVYLINNDGSADAFYIGTVIPLLVTDNTSISSNINQNIFMSAFRYKSTSDLDLLQFDLRPQQENSNADITEEYEIQVCKGNYSLEQRNFNSLGSFQVKDDQKIQFATVSPINGDYFIFYYYEHKDENETIQLKIIKESDSLQRLTSSDFLTLQFNENAPQSTLYESVHIQGKNNQNDTKFSMKFAKKSDINSEKVFVQTFIIEKKENGKIPQFDQSKASTWKSIDVDNKGIIAFDLDLSENEECSSEFGCTLFIHFSYKNGEKSPNFHIDCKRDISDDQKTPLDNGKFREVTLTNEFPSEYMLHTIDLTKANFEEYQIIGKNFEKDDLEYEITVNGKKQKVNGDSERGTLQNLENSAAQVLKSFAIDDLKKICGVKRFLKDEPEDDDEDEPENPEDPEDPENPEDPEDPEDPETPDVPSDKCEIKVEILKPEKSKTEFTRGAVTATVQHLEVKSSEGKKVYGPVMLPPYNSQKHMKTITETYSKSHINKDEESYIVYHFEIVAVRNERKIINLMQSVRDGSQFHLTAKDISGKSDREFPVIEDADLEEIFETEEDLSTARYAFGTCNTDPCNYLVTLYIKIGDKAEDVNTFFIESRDYKEKVKALGDKVTSTTNPRQNEVMEFYKKVSIGKNEQFMINIYEDKIEQSNKRLLKDEPESEEEETDPKPDEPVTPEEEETDPEPDEPVTPDEPKTPEQGSYVVCFLDDNESQGNNLRIIDTFNTGYPVGIMNPIDNYFIFYYSHSLKKVKHTVRYSQSSDDKPLFDELEEKKTNPLEFTQEQGTHFVHYKVQHLSTSEVGLHMSFDTTKDTKKPMTNLKTSVQTYAKTQRNNVYPTPHETQYTVEDFVEDGEGNDKQDINVAAKWVIKNQELGCAEGCNMLYRFDYNGKITQPLTLNIKTVETVKKPEPIPGSDLGLILGLTFGGLVIVAIGAFLFIRQQRKKQQSHLDYQDLEYKDNQTKVNKYEEEGEDEEEG